DREQVLRKCAFNACVLISQHDDVVVVFLSSACSTTRKAAGGRRQAAELIARRAARPRPGRLLRHDDAYRQEASKTAVDRTTR
ncbi:hypothetical protein, partial [Xanthomonas oryzae]|uniref:hypothetical protein n=1 Tax=Xanthomonas oryzae TaxID=347 RepID=UPI000960199F